MIGAMANPTMYGIPNCDTVKKARAWLTEQGVPFEFHDFKKQGLTPAQALGWTQQLPWEQLLNKRGTTWRGLPAQAQTSVVDAATAAALMAEHPSLVKRPVMAWPDGTLTVGFNAADWAQHAVAR